MYCYKAQGQLWWLFILSEAHSYEYISAICEFYYKTFSSSDEYNVRARVGRIGPRQLLSVYYSRWIDEYFIKREVQWIASWLFKKGHSPLLKSGFNLVVFARKQKLKLHIQWNGQEFRETDIHSAFFSFPLFALFTGMHQSRILLLQSRSTHDKIGR